MARSSLRTQRLDEFLAEPRQPDMWLVDRLLPREGVIILAGPPKVGKTLLALNIALAVASTSLTDVLGRNVAIHGPVLIIEEEGSRDGFANRLDVLLRSVPDPDRSATSIELAFHAGLRIDSDEAFAPLVRAIEWLRPKIVVIDPMSRLHALDENQSSAMAPAMARLNRMSAEHSTLVLLLHHTPKHDPTRGRGSPGFYLRGSSVLASSSDGNLALASDRGNLILRTELRDAEAATIKLQFDWSTYRVSGKSINAPAMSRQQRDSELLAAEVADRGAITIAQAVAVLGGSPGTARSRLVQLEDDGRLESFMRGRARVWRSPTVNLSGSL